MDSIKALLNEHSDRYPEFDYYLPLIDKAVSDLVAHPDICIETCKSLLEGVSKSIIEKLPTNAHNRLALDDMKFDRLVKLALQQLKLNDNVVEDDFVNRCSSLANSLGNLRNTRGDISHGKGVPKLEQSTDKLSRLCVTMTESVLHYMLDAFFTIPEPEPEEPERLKYDDNQEFNEFLDDENPIDGMVSYSRALYDQYYEDYTIQLSDWEYNQELEESEEDEDDDQIGPLDDSTRLKT